MADAPTNPPKQPAPTAKPQLIHVASLTWVDEDVVAWSLSTVGVAGELDKDAAVPWEFPVMPDAKFKCLWLSDKGVILDDKVGAEEVGASELSEEQRKAVESLAWAALEMTPDKGKAALSTKRLALLHSRRSDASLSATPDVDDHSASGALAGLSQQGHAIANPLGLVKWLKLSSKEKPVGAKYLAVWPQTANLIWEWDEKAFTQTKESTTAALLAAGGGEIQFNLLEDSAIPKEMETFLQPLGSPINAAHFTNWRANLTQTLGDYIDLGWWWRQALTEVTKDGKWTAQMNHPTNDGAAWRVWKVAWKMVSSTMPPQFRLEKNLGHVMEAFSACQTYLYPMLALFHDHADLGLRQAVEYRDHAPNTLAAALDGTVAVQLWSALSLPHDGEDGEHQAALAFFEQIWNLDGLKQQSPVLSSLLFGEKEEMFSWMLLIAETLEDLDATPLDGAYGDLYYFLALFTLRPAAFMDEILPPAEASEKLGRKLSLAAEQVCYLIEDDEVLLRLWARQWEMLLATKGKPGEWPPLAEILGAEAAKEAKPLTNRLDKLRDFLANSGRSLCQRYGDGLAGEFWDKVIGTLGLPAQPGKPNPEAGTAEACLKAVLTEYFDARVASNKAAVVPWFAMPALSDDQRKSLQDAYQKPTIHPPNDPPQPRHWKFRVWPKRMIGNPTDEQDAISPLPVPPPLPVPAIFQNYKVDEHAGLLVFAARGSKDKEKQWWIANVGDSVIYNPVSTPAGHGGASPPNYHETPDALADDVAKTPSRTLTVETCTPAPWQLNESHGITQACLDYRGQPAMVRLWEDYADDPTSNQETTANAKEQKKGPQSQIMRQQIVGQTSQGWGPVPGLRYDAKEVYWFAFAPIANSGALPRALRAAVNQPSTLSSRQDLKIAPTVEQILEITNYTRRVKVGEIRLVHESAATSKDKVHSLRQPGISFPDIPAGVRPMAIDLQKETEAYLQELGKLVGQPDFKPTQERPQLPSHIILLREGQGADEVKLALRPPATEIENWSIWVASVTNTEGGVNEPNKRYDLIADARRYVRELRSGMHGGFSKDEVNDLLDDPAVCGVWVQAKQIYPTVVNGQADSGYYIPFPDPEDYAETLNDDSLLAPLLETTCAKVRKFVRKVSTQIVIISGQPAWQSKVQNEATILVGPGQIVQVELIPCVKKSALERFGIYKVAQQLNLKDKGTELCGIRSASSRLWVESVPNATESPPKYLPSTDEVWKALQLGAVGEHQGERVKVPRLEVIVNPQGMLHPDAAAGGLDGRWCFVSEVAAEIQPWIWRGMPEAASGTNGGLWEIVSAQREDSKLTSAELLDNGEMPSFAEREDASALEVTGLVNVVNVTQQLGKGSVIYQDRGEQEEQPRYYRVRLRVYSRYQGLGAGHAIPVHSYKQLDFPARKDPERPAETRITHHKRIGFRGKLPQRLNLPRVKLVIPLLESSSTTGRPGFLVLTRETLASPFHRLQAAIEWAELNDPTKPEVRQALPEFGPDPLTSGESFDWSFRDQKALQAASILEGKAIGLTYEREASDPLFANASFYFDVPMAEQNGPAAHVWDKHDLFLKIKFRWAILPQNVMDNPASDLVSEFTNGWQVRLLAPLDHLVTADSTRQDFSELRCKLVDQSPEFEKKLSGGKWGAFPVQTPKFDPNLQNPKASPAAAFVFVAWSLVPDFLNAEPSKLTHSLYLWNEKKWIQLQRNDAAPAPSGGNFLLLFSRQGDLEKLIDDCSIASTKKEDSLDHLLEFLFGNSARSQDKRIMDEDAKGMLVRCSPVIDIL